MNLKMSYGSVVCWIRQATCTCDEKKKTFTHSLIHTYPSFFPKGKFTKGSNTQTHACNSILSKNMGSAVSVAENFETSSEEHSVWRMPLWDLASSVIVSPQTMWHSWKSFPAFSVRIPQKSLPWRRLYQPRGSVETTGRGARLRFPPGPCETHVAWWKQRGFHPS